jgi:formate hydrogenlyase subunit 4
MKALSVLHPVLAVVLAPLLQGIIQRVKAWFAGRSGPPLLQPYRDMARLLRKGAVFSRTTTWVFRAAAPVVLATTLGALTLLPAGGLPALLSFQGDFLLFVYLLALGRFALILAALDTGSSFEGMGASREAAFGALAEPAVLLGLAAAIRATGELSLTRITASAGSGGWSASSPALLLVVVSMLAVFLAENARIPVDDPNTHLELTMIHEVMILDHSGPDLALLEYAAALKLWVFGGLIVGLAVPARAGGPMMDLAAFLAGMLVLAVLVGAIESSLARLRLLRVPQFLVGAAAASALALVLLLR